MPRRENWPADAINVAASEIVKELEEQGCDCNVERQCAACEIVANVIRPLVKREVRRALKRRTACPQKR